MPISDADGYEKGHFNRVYEHLIKPACELGGLEAYRVDDDKASDIIHCEIFSQLVNSPMAICDISSRNPNVFFELGVRLAFNKPVTIIKDDKTEKAFDIGIIKYIDYDSRLQYGEVIKAHKDIAESLKQTLEKGSINFIGSFISGGNHNKNRVSVKQVQTSGIEKVCIDDVLPELLERYLPDALIKIDKGK